MTMSLCEGKIAFSTKCRVNYPDVNNWITYFSEYWTMRPFFDHVIQLGPGTNVSDRFSTRMTFGASLVGGLATLQTLKSLSDVCVASISDFCFDDEACHARPAIGDGPLK